MFAEYARLIGSFGETVFSGDFVKSWPVFLIAGILLVFLGYQVKKLPGAIIAVLIGLFLYLYFTNSFSRIFGF
jgi:hypothetical protein